MSIPLLTTEGVQTILHSDMSTGEKAQKIVLYVHDAMARMSNAPFRRENVDRIERMVKKWEEEHKDESGND